MVDGWEGKISIIEPRVIAFADHAGGHFVAMCYEIFLGRELDSLGVAEERGRWPGDEVFRSILESDEFIGTLRCLLIGRGLRQDPSRACLTISQRFWIIQNLPLSRHCAEILWLDGDRRVIIGTLLQDETLMQRAGLSVITNLPDVIEEDSERSEDHEIGLSGSERARPLWTDGAGALLHLWS